MGEYLSWDPETGVLTVKLQQGPIKVHGVNGVQIDDVIGWCRDRIVEFNSACASKENSWVIENLNAALKWLSRRTRVRESRGVEGTNKE